MQRLLGWADWDVVGGRDDLRSYVVEHLGDRGGVLNPTAVAVLNVRQLRETTPSAGMAFAPGLDEPLAAEH